MSDVEKDVSGLGRGVLRTARVNGLRRRMTECIETHEDETELRELRTAPDADTGKPISEIVDEGRNERI